MSSAPVLPVQMTGKEFSDAETGAKWALEFGQYIANSKGWTTAQKNALEADIQASLEDADAASWWGYSASAFWETLRERSARAAWLAAPGGVDVAETYGAAVAAAETAADREAAESVVEQVAGAAVASAEDAGTIATTAGKAAQNPAVWLLVAAVAVAILVKR